MHAFWTRQLIIEPDRLNAAIQQLHHASQLIAAVGQSLLPAAHDDSHINMEWLPDREMLAGDTIDDRIRIGLEVKSFSLCLSDRDGDCVERYPLDGSTLAQGYGWLRKQLNLQGFAGERLQPIDHYELPSHPILRGGAFQRPAHATLEELCICYHNAYGILTGVAKRDTPQASGVRVWPHHFDMALLIEIRHNDQGTPSATIGVGLAVADELADVPYYYVKPWQDQGPVDLQGYPDLLVGHWDTKQFHGALLPLNALPTGPARQQQEVVETVLREAIHHCRSALDG